MMNSRYRPQQSGAWSWDQNIYHGTENLFQLIQRSSDSYGDSPFLIPVEDGLKTITFSDLLQMTMSLDRHLTSQGVHQQQRIAVIYPNSTLMVLLYLCTIAAGRVLVPINPKSGHSEVKYILEATKPDMVICSAASSDKLLTIHELNKVVIEDQIDFLAEVFSEKDVARDLALAAEPVAEIVFTSGTTGNPKGVMLTHRNILADSFAIGTMFNFTQGMNFLTTTPMFHNSGQIPTTTVPLWCGGTTTPIRPELGLIKFDYFVNRFNSNWSFVTPSFLAFLMSATKTEDISSLEGLFVGGANLSPAMMEQFEAKYSIPLYEAYGLTETTSFATCVRKDISKRRHGSAGVPLFVNELKIHEPQQREDTGKAVGEIIIKGENVFREYLDQPELTAEKKRDDWFYSGDLGYMDGEDLYVIDRIDNMILVGGENVYPTEIERLIPNMDGVIDGVLTSRPHSVLGNELVLVYEAESGATKQAAIWKKMFGHHISNFKVPGVFIEVSELALEGLPRADNGKILRKKLYDLVNSSES